MAATVLLRERKSTGMRNVRVPAPAVSTAVRLLEELARRKGTASLDELTKIVGQPRSSVHRVLTTLVSEGVVDRFEPRGGYALGGLLDDWSSAHLALVKGRENGHVSAAPPARRGTRRASGETPA